jgi:hypothetical protein
MAFRTDLLANTAHDDVDASAVANNQHEDTYVLVGAVIGTGLLGGLIGVLRGRR